MFSHLVKNSAWLFLARLWTQVGMALFIILAARKLGGTGFGEYSFMAAWVVIGNMLTTFGTDMVLIREIAAGGHHRQLPAALILQISLSALFVTGVFLSTPYLTFQSFEGVTALRIYSLSLFPLAFFTVFTTVLRGKQQMGAYAVVNILLTSIQVIAAGIFYFGGFDLVGLAGLLLSTQVIAAILAGILCSVRIPNFWGGWQFSVQDIFLLVNASAPMALLSGLMILYQRLSPALLPFLFGALPAGLFSAAARVVEVAKVGHIAVFTAIYPVMAQRKSRDIDWLQSFRPEWLVLLGAAALASLGMFLLAGPLIGWLFGEEYRPSIPVLKILAWTLLPYTINTFLNLAFLANGDEPVVLGALSASLIALASLTLWLGQAAGPQGAAWAVLYAESIQSAILLLQAARHLRGTVVITEEA